MSRRLLIAGLAAALSISALPVAGAKVIKHPKDLATVTRTFFADPSRSVRPRLAGKCPTAATCDAFKLGKARWATVNGVVAIPFSYSDVGRPSDAPSADASRAALTRAVSAWDARNSTISFRNLGASTARPGNRAQGATCGDGRNTIGWERLGGKALGVTTLCYDRKTKQIREADLAMNSSIDWAILAAANPSGRTYDLQSVYTHEIGHFFSLLDLRTGRQSAQTMFGSAQPGEIHKRTLALGDVLGLQKAYPCSCSPGSIVSD